MFAKPLLIKCSLFCLLILVTMSAVNSQPVKPSGAKPVLANEAIEITLHKAILKNDSVQFINGDNNKVVVGDAIPATEIDKGFNASDKVVIRVKSPIPFYIYIVNASDWDGVSLVQPSRVQDNKQFPANETTDFPYEFTRDSKKASTGREEFFILITKAKIPSPKLSDIQQNDNKISISATQIEQLKSELSSTQGIKLPPEDVNVNGQSRVRSIFSVGCKTFGAFFPFIKVSCKLVGLGAKPIFNNDDEITIVPNSTDKNAFRLSFAVTN